MLFRYLESPPFFAPINTYALLRNASRNVEIPVWFTAQFNLKMPMDSSAEYLWLTLWGWILTGPLQCRGQGREKVHRQGEDDGGVFFHANFSEGLQVTQLEGKRLGRERLGSVSQALSG